MRTISGEIACPTKSEIPDGANVTINVIDCGRMDVAAITLGQQIINDPKCFPLHFEVEFDDSFLQAEMFHGRYAINCRIEVDGKLYFINDTHFNIVSDRNTKKLKDHLDFHVIEVVI